MKNIREIEIQGQEGSFKKKFSYVRTLLKIKLLLPPRFRDATEFMYVKNRTLFFALNHPGLVMEFNYNLSLIKDILKKFDFSTLGSIDEVKCFVINRVKEPEQEVELYTYEEHSDGKFINHIEDDRLRGKLEEIRELICSNS